MYGEGIVVKVHGERDDGSKRIREVAFVGKRKI